MRKTKVYRAAVHAGEERQISGNSKSGMILFSGCHLACNFCYTPEVVSGEFGTEVDQTELQHISEKLIRVGAQNLSFISVTHVWPTLRAALLHMRAANKLSVPVVLKMSGFESNTFAKEMAELADVLIPDFKVMGSQQAEQVGLPSQYGSVALQAVSRMASLHPNLRFNSNGLIESGVVVRHLLMPGFDTDSSRVIQSLGSIGFKGALNLMTCFVDGTAHTLHRANAFHVESLSDQAANLGMTVLVDGKMVPIIRTAVEGVA